MYAILSLAHDVGFSCGCKCGNSYLTRFPNIMSFSFPLAAFPSGKGMFLLSLS